jgi:hypothetical protein
MKFVQEADTDVFHRLDRFEVLDNIGQSGWYRDAAGQLQEVKFEPSRFDAELLSADVVPCPPGYHLLCAASIDLGEAQIHRIAIVAWRVTPMYAFPITADWGASTTEMSRYEDAIEFPDGHVEYVNKRFDSVEEYCRCFGKVPPGSVPTFISPVGSLN